MLLAQAPRQARSVGFTEIKWDVYTFKFLPGNQMAQVLDSSGHVIGTILAANGTLTIITTLTGDGAEKLKQSFQAWKDQGGEKALTNQAAVTPSKSRPAPQQARASESPAPVTTTSAPARSDAPATGIQRTDQPGHGILNAEGLDQLQSGGLRFDLNAIRSDPRLLDQKPVMQYFIAVNNCGDSSIQRTLQNELDYPALAQFYSAKAPQILSALPDTAGLMMFQGNSKGALLWGNAIGGWDTSLKTLALGEYDLSRKVFPILVSDKSKKFDIAGTLRVDVDRKSLEKSCPAASNTLFLSKASTSLPAAYSITLADDLQRIADE